MYREGIKTIITIDLEGDIGVEGMEVEEEKLPGMRL